MSLSVYVCVCVRELRNCFKYTTANIGVFFLLDVFINSIQ